MLNPTTLYDGLMAIDDQTWPTTSNEVARRWFEAWWGYASGMMYLNPASVAGLRAASQAAFVAQLTPAVVPAPTPGAFFLAVQGAQLAAWAVLAAPAALTPPLVSATPAAPVLAGVLVSIVPLGLKLSTKHGARQALASAIDAWTRTFIVVGPTGPVGPFA